MKRNLFLLVGLLSCVVLNGCKSEKEKILDNPNKDISDEVKQSKEEKNYDPSNTVTEDE
ncbi:hypothetical protein [Metabacillus niabensis]|uniref:hypothetical protein n=1 Tax=Metabacillus TaxID=2675233 RepID=UPI0014835BAB